MPSIAARITAGFYILAFLLLALSAITLSNLHFLAEHIRAGAAVSTFVEGVMETRRHEKNYFLYQDDSEGAAAQQQAGTARVLLEDNVELFEALCVRHPCAQLGEAISEYERLLAGLKEQPSHTVSDQAEAVRHAGHRVNELAQGLSERERASLSEALTQGGRWLLGAVLGVGVLGIGVGRLTARSLVVPLRRLESDLAPIAAGRFRELPAPSRDRELVSFTVAFNRMLAELKDRQRQLQHAEKLASLGVLVSGVAHELNNPLSNISTSCQLALEEVEVADPTQLRTWLTQIDEQTERARHILLALADYTRRRPLTREAVLVSDLLDTTLLLVRKELGRQVTLERALPDGLAILADPQRLQQVFINLLKNAVDAGGPQVTIRITANQMRGEAARLPQGQCRLGGLPGPTGCFVLITLADDGPGIAPEDIEHIFDPFFTTRGVGEGMGLGLYIVQDIVQELEGCIAVDSAPGKGTRFEIALPCVPAAAETREANGG